LDRNGNGAIDNGGELFGEFTLQPDPLPGERKTVSLRLPSMTNPQTAEIATEFQLS
jgi:hypothetical protein